MIRSEQRRYGMVAESIQRVYRGHRARKSVRELKQDRAARHIQRVGRGRLARRRVSAMKDAIGDEERRLRAAVKLQATWRMHTTLSGYKSLQLFQVSFRSSSTSSSGFRCD